MPKPTMTVKEMKEVLIPDINDGIKPMGAFSGTADRAGGWPRDPMTEVTIKVETGTDIRFPEFLIRFMKAITAP